MRVNSAGLISGTPTGTGRFSFNVTAKDANQVTYTKTMNLYVIGAPPAQPSLFAYGNLDDCVLGQTAPVRWVFPLAGRRRSHGR